MLLGSLEVGPGVMDARKLAVATALHRETQTPAAEICRTLSISKATFYRSMKRGANMTFPQPQ